MPPCANASVCGGDAGAREFCQLCSALMACRRLPLVGRGECGVCYDTRPLYRLPMCSHTLCATCTREIMLGTTPAPTTGEGVADFIETNMARMLHQQRCPFCRLSVSTSIGTRLRDIRAHNRGTRGPLLAFVIAGLELVMEFS